MHGRMTPAVAIAESGRTLLGRSISLGWTEAVRCLEWNQETGNGPRQPLLHFLLLFPTRGSAGVTHRRQGNVGEPIFRFQIQRR